MLVSRSTIFLAASGATARDIQQLLREVSGCEVIGHSENVSEVVRQVASMRPALVIIEQAVPTFDTVELIGELRTQADGIRFLLLVSEESEFWSVLASRAEGYVMWPTAWLPNAIRTIANGGVWLGPILAEYLLRGPGWEILRSTSTAMTELPSLLAVLSGREREVLKHLLDGLTNQQIADCLQLSVGTIKVHVKHILNKLNVEYRGQAIAKVAKMQGASQIQHTRPWDYPHP